jgi:hypothetical protein
MKEIDYTNRHISFIELIQFLKKLNVISTYSADKFQNRLWDLEVQKAILRATKPFL